MFEWITGLFYQQKKDAEEDINEDWMCLNLDGSITHLDTKSKAFTKADYEVIETLYYHLQAKHRDITKEVLPIMRDRELKMIKASKLNGHSTRSPGFLRNPSIRSWQIKSF
ncbi:hypothetical protein K7432_003386 [Basidiobolus ranarum]|uniref:Uncharacterized protein n=1 Tax=Basidiobolus ranarum TaxID=34480 RepID=A0ABR2X013_9FUNG